MLLQIYLPAVYDGYPSSRIHDGLDHPPITNRRNNNQLTEDPNSGRSQQQKSKRGLFGKILYEGFKIGLTIGASIIASAVAGPIAGMVVGGLISAAFSASEQYAEKGKVDWKRVGIEFGFGFVSIGVG